MSVEVRYRTLDGERVGERVVRIDDADQLLRTLEVEAPFGATIAHLARLALPDGAPDHEFVGGLRGDVGAIYYTDEDGSWYTSGPTPDDDGPVFAEVDFPSHCEVPRDRLGEALREFLDSDGRRPSCVEWHEDPYRSAISG